MTDAPHHSRRSSKYRRARIRNFLFTSGPNRLSGGRLVRRHLAQDLVVRRIEVVSPNWPDAFDGLRIGHVSDFHIGELVPVDRAIEAVSRLGDERPDFIACTGDVVDLHAADAAPVLAAIARLDAPLGAAMVLGNHDHLDSPWKLAGLAEAAGVRVLANQAMQVTHNGRSLLIGGIDWSKSAVQCARLVDAACGDFVHLLLAHNPRAFLRAADLGIPLTLAGHTHGGQVAVKDRSNANLAITHRRSVGLFDSHGSRMYVTAGVGAWFPLRVNCPPEVAILTMRRAEVPIHEAGNGRPRRRC
jgi:predicted MPP superfamily phosphohydrolase